MANTDWLKNAVFYEIYPQSFYDANGDGIGDLQGIIQKLDYVKELGCNAIWLNPLYDSPFKDAGYDVRDYKKVAPRYGTNEDLYALFAQAHKRDMHVILDLVPGHTSEEHAWFLESQKAEKNAYSDRYIWTDMWYRGCPGMLSIGGECERNGTYMLNFFKCQPALNYGFLHPTESWQLSMDHPSALATREALKDIMRFWLDHGCDGFRVDMADSLVKMDDAQKSGTSLIWQDIRKMLDQEYPSAVMVSEWGNPTLSLKAGFHMDFYLNHEGNGYESLLRDYHHGEDRSYFKREAKDRDISRFLSQYVPWYQETKKQGYISLLTCNHDTPRPRWSLGEKELKIAYAVLFTLPGVPFLYYGDEIGMRYLADLKTKEGGYTRTGSRTPMQWSKGKNLGFSEADAQALYLPVDASSDAPDVESQIADSSSLYATVHAILALRHQYADLQADGPFKVVESRNGQPFVYARGRMLICVNPSGETLRYATEKPYQLLFTIGKVENDTEGITLHDSSFAVLTDDAC